MEIKEGMYVRFEGMINKIVEIEDNYIYFDKGWLDHWLDEVYTMRTKDFIHEYKPIASFDLLDVLEVGDIIFINNLCGEITKIDKENNKIIYTTCYDERYCSSKDIKRVLTKEQSIGQSYRIGE